MASTDHMEDVKRTILGMSEFMQVISGSQKYLQRKLERHQKTMVREEGRGGLKRWRWRWGPTGGGVGAWGRHGK